MPQAVDATGKLPAQNLHLLQSLADAVHDLQQELVFQAGFLGCEMLLQRRHNLNDDDRSRLLGYFCYYLIRNGRAVQAPCGENRSHAFPEFRLGRGEEVA